MDTRFTTTPLIRLLTVLATLFAVSSAWAQDHNRGQKQDQDTPWYQVEVVVFKHADTTDTEAWPDDPGGPDLTHAVELIPPSTSSVIERDAGGNKDRVLRLLPANQDRLGSVITRLNRAGDYQVLYHAAWRQPAYAPANSIPVHIHYGPPGVQDRTLSTVADSPAQQAGEQVQGDGAVLPASAPMSEAQFSEQQPGPAEASAPPSPSWLLDGVIDLAQSRYLHLDVDLVYQVNTLADQSQRDSMIGDTVTTRTYRLRQSRRIRSDDLYYFDHPRFGVLARITPFTPPPPPTPPQTGKAGQTQTQHPPNR